LDLPAERERMVRRSAFPDQRVYFDSATILRQLTGPG
jgi:hypothetical protein